MPFQGGRPAPKPVFIAAESRAVGRAPRRFEESNPCFRNGWASRHARGGVVGRACEIHQGSSVRKRNLPGSPLPPSTEGRVTRLAAQRARGSCDLDALLREAGLTPAELEDSHARIEVRKQLRFLALAADELRDDLLGFHLAQSFEPRELGLLYYVHASSATLGEALSRVARYSSVAHEGLTMSAIRGGVKLEIAYVGVPRHVDRHQMEWLVTVLIRICRELTRTSVCPVRVAFAHPRCAASQALEQTPAHAVEFGCDRDLLEFSAAASSLPLASANPYLNECLVRYWEDALAGRARRQHSMRAAVENVVLPLLPHGNARAGRVAEALGLSTRTLTRRLAAEGVTFAEVLDEMRAELALATLRIPRCRCRTSLGSWASRRQAPSRTPSGDGPAKRRASSGRQAALAVRLLTLSRPNLRLPSSPSALLPIRAHGRPLRRRRHRRSRGSRWSRASLSSSSIQSGRKGIRSGGNSVRRTSNLPTRARMPLREPSSAAGTSGSAVYAQSNRRSACSWSSGSMALRAPPAQQFMVL